MGLSVATVNVAGQVVLGGPVAALDALAADPPDRARVRRLEVSGAFHTAAMAPAADRLRAVLADLVPAPPAVRGRRQRRRRRGRPTAASCWTGWSCS